MKKIATMPVFLLSTILLLSAMHTATSQLMNVKEKKMLVTGTPGSYLEPSAEVHNNTAADLSVRVQRTDVTMPQGWAVSFCLVNCYSPEASDVVDIIPAGETYTMKPTFETTPVAGEGSVTYTLSPVQNPSEKYVLTFRASTNSTSTPDVTTIPRTVTLAQNYPNPFSLSGYAVTSIAYGLPRNGFVTVKVFNLIGREVRTLVSEVKPAGSYTAIWDGRDDQGAVVPSGIYVYKISTGSSNLSRRMLLSH